MCLSLHDHRRHGHPPTHARAGATACAAQSGIQIVRGSVHAPSRAPTLLSHLVPGCAQRRRNWGAVSGHCWPAWWRGRCQRVTSPVHDRPTDDGQGSQALGGGADRGRADSSARRREGGGDRHCVVCRAQGERAAGKTMQACRGGAKTNVGGASHEGEKAVCAEGEGVRGVETREGRPIDATPEWGERLQDDTLAESIRLRSLLSTLRGHPVAPGLTGSQPAPPSSCACTSPWPPRPAAAAASPP